VAMAQLAHAEGESILRREGWRHGSSYLGFLVDFLFKPRKP